MSREIVTCSSDETFSLGRRLGSLIEDGDFIALYGDLGSGKTRFTAGIVLGTSVPADIPVTSPTYTYMNEYHGRISLYHFDLYRIHTAHDILELGFEDIFYGTGACVVEWADRIKGVLPHERLDITFLSIGDTERRLIFTAHGFRHQILCEKLFDFQNRKMF